TAPLPRHAVLASEPHQVPVDEEKLGKAGLFDDLQLVLQAPGDSRGDGAIPFPETSEAQLVEEGERRLAGGHRVAGKADLAEVEVDVALLRDGPGRGQRLVISLEERTHLGTAFEVVLRVGEEVLARVVEGGAMLDGDQHVVQPASGREG